MSLYHKYYQIWWYLFLLPVTIDVIEQFDLWFTQANWHNHVIQAIESSPYLNTWTLILQVMNHR